MPPRHRQRRHDFLTIREQQARIDIANEYEQRRHAEVGGHATSDNQLRRITQHEAKGHLMRTGTARDGTVWIWCATCGAYTSERYRSLGEECTGNKNTGQKRRLERGNHPIQDVPIGLEPRDMSWSDVDAVQLLEACIQMGAADDDPVTPAVPTIWEDDDEDDGHSLGDPGGVALGGCLSPLDAWDYAW